jgi:hypothetical protein
MALDYTYDTREVTHGDAYGAFAQIVESTATPGTLDTTVVPAVFTGLRGVDFESTQETTKYYADNVEHVRVLGNKVTEGTITCYQFPKAFATNHLGFKESSNGGLIDVGTFKNFIFQYIETVTDALGNDLRLLTVFYNLKASTPTAVAATDEETATPKEFSIACTASPQPLLVDSGTSKAVSMFQLRETSTNGALIDLAYTQIILPTTPVPT